MSRSEAGLRVRGLYALTPDGLSTPELVRKVEAALGAGIDLLQYRCKSRDASVRREQAEALARLCRNYGTTFIVNDDVELARAVAADGVHLGRDDAPPAQARALLGEAALVGASCYDRLELALEAVAGGADHVAFGSMFASTTKPDAVRAPLDLLERARSALHVPVVAIGGIDCDNAASVAAAGADAVAVASAVFAPPDTWNAVRRIRAAFSVGSAIRPI